MRIYLIICLCISLFIIACSPTQTQILTIETPILGKIPSSTATIKPDSTFTPSPSLTPTLHFQLPPDCQNLNPSIDPKIYEAYDFENIPCEHLSISPDGSAIVYVTLEQTFLANNLDDVSRVTKLYLIPSSQTIQIYISKCNYLYIEWGYSGNLIISDFPQDVGCGYTIIYNLNQKRIIETLEGAVDRGYRNNWTLDNTAFFTLSPESFAPACDESFSGFDLRSEKKFPTIKPITVDTNLYVVIGKPIWMPDSKTLLATIRDGVCSTENNLDCKYKNSYIVSFNLSGSSPELSYPFYDTSIDYSFHQTEQGIVEFIAKPSEVLSCWDVSE